MATLYNANNILEVLVRAGSYSQAFINVLHYWTNNPTEPDTMYDMENLADAFRTRWRDHIIPSLRKHETFAYEFREIVGWEVKPNNQRGIAYGQQFILPGEGQDSSEGTGVILPTYNAYGVRKVTEKAGRAYRGGMRLGPVQDEHAEDNMIPDVPHGTFQAALDAFLPELSFETDAPDDSKVILGVFARSTFLKSDVADQNEPSKYWARCTKLILSKYLTSQVSRKQRFKLN